MTTIPSVTSLATSLGEFPPEAVIFGHSEVMQSLRDRMDKVASANVPVLIQGESGTGKDIIARMIHGLSPWRNGPFVKLNCPAIRGTLFLDEISELDLGLQSKLLQLLQDGQFCRIGAQEDKKVEVRVVCATNRVLEAEIESGTFRQDLFYRINVVNLQMPPLRERKGDIPDLVAYFLEYYNRKYNCRARTLSGDLMTALQKHHWPGNIRELENLIKRYVILGNEEVISSDLVAHQQEFPTLDLNFDGPIALKVITRQATRELERKVILKVLQAHHWNRKQAARALSISYRALLYKIRDAGLPPNRSSRRPQPVPAQDVAAD